GIDSAYEFLKRSPQFTPGPIHTQRKLDAVKGDIDEEFWEIPALAVPTPDTKPFVCPPEHVEFLKGAIRTAKKILIIGWRAGDQPLIDLLEKELTHPAFLCIVSGSPKGIETVKVRLGRVSNLDFIGGAQGFSNFLSSDTCSLFFNS